MWKRLMERVRAFTSPKQLMKAALREHYPHEKMQEPRRQTMYCYKAGPMFYLGQQIVKAMQDAGYPAKILYCHRTEKEQQALYDKGRTSPGPIVTRAKPWSSAHNYSEAVDIIHPGLAWKVTEDYWTALAACVEIIEQKFNVKLTHGHDWDDDGIPVHLDDDERFRDSAHIQMSDWRDVKVRHRRNVERECRDRGMPFIMRAPLEAELWRRFIEVLPDVAKRR